MSLSHFEKANWLSRLDEVNFYHMLGFFQIAHLEPKFKIFFRPYIENIARCLFRNDDDLQQLEKIKELFPTYDLNFNEFMKIDRNYNTVKDVIDAFFANIISEEIDSLIDNATSTSEVSSVKRDLERRITQQYDKVGIYETPDLGDFDKKNWDAICLNNYFAEQMRKGD